MNEPMKRKVIPPLERDPASSAGAKRAKLLK
jgi:hypothetical protein